MKEGKGKANRGNEGKDWPVRRGGTLLYFPISTFDEGRTKGRDEKGGKGRWEGGYVRGELHNREYRSREGTEGGREGKKGRRNGVSLDRDI